VAQIEDVLEVYHRPYNPKRPVICFDEGGKELHSIPRGTLPMCPGQAMRQDYEWERHGMANLITNLDEPPLRLLFGSDAARNVEQADLARLESDRKWRELSISTDFEASGDSER